MPLRWTEEQLEAWKGRLGGAAREDQVSGPAPHKYRASPTVVDGIRFDSKLEARYYERLLLRQAAGEVVGFLRQVPIHLPGKTKLVVDFLEFRRRAWHKEGELVPVFVDTKGFETEVFKVKVRQVRELYPWIRLEIVRRVS